MIRYIIKRILWMIPVLLGVTFIVFTINRMTPGDPIYALMGSNITQEQYDAKEAELGLDKPFLTQFAVYVKGIVVDHDLGTSYQTKRPVSTEIAERFMTTIKLGLLGVLVTVIIGIPFGIISATKQNSPLDYGVTTVSMFFAAMPNFWLALMMIILFAYRWPILPASGLTGWKSWILPVLAVGLSPVASVTRMTRSSMLEVIRQDYVRTARAKGLSEGVIIRKHALKNALLNVITVVGFQISMVMGGSVIIETIFTIPGLGTLMMAAINSNNYPVIQGCVFVIAVTVCVMNLLVDLVYGLVDPRVMAQYTGGGKKKKKKTQKEAAA